MGFNLSIGSGLNDGPYNTAIEKSPSGTSYKPRTLREQLQDKLAYHQSEITKIQEAINALTPDVEKALDALGKL